MFDTFLNGKRRKITKLLWSPIYKTIIILQLLVKTSKVYKIVNLWVLAALYYLTVKSFLILVSRPYNISNTLPKHLHPLAVRIKYTGFYIFYIPVMIEVGDRFYPHGLKNTSEANVNLIYLPSQFIYKFCRHTTQPLCRPILPCTLPTRKKKKKN